MEDVVQEALSKGVELHNSGQFDLAKELYASVINLVPRHADANHNTGVIEMDAGSISLALPHLRIALEEDGSNAQYWISYIDALIRHEAIDEARNILFLAKQKGAEGEDFDQLGRRINELDGAVLEAKRDNINGLFNKYNILDTLKLGQALKLAKKNSKENSPKEAQQIYNDILDRFPKNKKAIKELNALDVYLSKKFSDPSQDELQVLTELYNNKKMQQAFDQAMQLINVFPNSLKLYNIIGAINVGLGNLDDAEVALRKALILDPRNGETYNNIGIVLKDQGEPEEAIKAFNQALFIKPDYATAYLNMGNTYKDNSKLDDAIDNYKKALALEPEYFQALNNMANVFREQGKAEEAIDAYNQILTISPDFAEAHFNMGVTLGEHGSLEKAIEALVMALAINPDFQIARAHKLHYQAQTCDWGAIRSEKNSLSKIGTDTQAVPAFTLMSFEDAPNIHLKRSKLFSKVNYPQKVIPLPSRPIKAPSRLRIGYFSSDFENHPVTYLITKMLALHNREEFEIFAYSFGASEGGPWRQKVVDAVDVFKEVKNMSDREISILARRDKIDIAVNLNGYTQGHRTGIFAFRAAPIQILYLGVTATMGTDFIDYIIADSVCIPKGMSNHFTENIIYLPNCFMGNDNTLLPSDRKVTRSECGLPEDRFVFCCFNNTYKISSDEFDIWMRVLNQVEGSVLWMTKPNIWAQKNLVKEAQERGVDGARLIFAEQLPFREHLTRQKLADLFVDTFNNTAGATGSAALWAGLPIVSKIGKGFPARNSASLLSALGLDELITKTEDEYEELILFLATNSARLHNIKQKLEANRLSQPLFDTALFTKNLENSFLTAYENYFTGSGASEIIV